MTECIDDHKECPKTDFQERSPHSLIKFGFFSYPMTSASGMIFREDSWKVLFYTFAVPIFLTPGLLLSISDSLFCRKRP